MPKGVYQRTIENLNWLRQHALRNSKARIGTHHSVEARQKISASNKGKPSWNFKGNKIDRIKFPNMGTIGKHYKRSKGYLRRKATPETILKMRLSHSGSRHRSWKGGITSIGKRIRRLPEYFEWRLLIYKKDGYICKSCGQIGRHADHIKPFSLLLKEFLENYNQFSPIDDIDTLVRLAINHTPFWDINNGQVLCKKCNCSKKDIFFNFQKKNGHPK